MENESSVGLIHFKSREEILERKDFDFNSSVTLENFLNVVGDFSFKEKEACQVLVKQGNCNHKFNVGFVVRTTEGREAMIGCDCANTKFHLSEKYKIEIARVNKEREWRELRIRADFYLENKFNLESWLNLDLKRLKDMEMLFKDIEMCIPRSFRDKCKRMIKVGDNIVKVRLRYVEIDEDGKEVVEWIDHNVGRLNSPSLIADNAFLSSKKKLIAIRSALSEVDSAVNSQHKTRLAFLLKILDEYVNTARYITKIRDDIGRFCSIDNIYVMRFMTESDEFRKNITRIYYIERGEPPTHESCKLLTDSIEQMAALDLKNRAFQIVA